MEEKKPKHTTEPGIPEALHPHIGNGAAWEQNKHAFMLRHPDASKHLEWRLQPHEIAPVENIQPLSPVERIDKPDPLLEDISIIESIITGQPENLQKAVQTESDEISLESNANDFSEIPDHLEEVKPKRNKKPSKEEKSSQVSESSIEEPKLQKPQKAGRLIKKAAKTVKRQEAAKNLLENPAIIPREITLSPYTNWLKGLAGSQYVHPYDEDYAFNQGVEASEGGISETFADLLANQGYKEQAIEMYIRLMEKYPEKSSFFAAKIEALQQQ